MSAAASARAGAELEMVGRFAQVSQWGSLGLTFAIRAFRVERNLLPRSLRKLVGSFWVTFAGQGVVLAGVFLVTRLSATRFGPVGFGEYQVARRTLAVVVFPLLCGIGVSMPRYMARDLGSKTGVAHWLMASAGLGVTLQAIFLGLGTLCAASLGKLTFGIDRRALVFSLLIAVAGQFCHNLAYAAMRGMSHFRSAAFLQVTDGVFAPLAGVLVAHGSVERALGVSGGIWVAVGTCAFVRICRQWARPLPSAADVLRAVRVLLSFGAPRIPGEVALFGLFALPAYAAVHRNDIVGAGFLSVGLSLVQAIAAVFAATGFVLLPYWSRAARSEDTLVVARRRICLLVVASGLVTALALIVLQVSLRSFAGLLLGPLAEAGLNDIRHVTLAAVPYVVYLVLRDYFDAISVFPMNTVALTGAIMVEAALLSGGWLSVPVATAGGFLALGLFMIALWAASRRQSGAASGNPDSQASREIAC